MSRKLNVINVNHKKENSENKKLLYENSLKRKRRHRQRVRQSARKKRRKRRQAKMSVFIVLMLGMMIGIGFLHLNHVFLWKTIDTEAQEGIIINQFLYKVKYEEFFEQYSPQKLDDEQVYERLGELTEKYPEFEEIYENFEAYPINLLASLCNNPELYEYVKGYLSYEKGNIFVALEPVLTKKEKQQKYPLFLQWDRRWGYEAYGDFNIALSGCGPTTLAMAATALTGNDTFTPDKVAKYSMENGHYVEGTGTAWTLITEGAKAFGIEAEELTLDENAMKKQLEKGNVIICSMSPGNFTAVGHFIMIYDYDENGFWLNDANCIYRSSRQWTYEELRTQIRMLWTVRRKDY